MCAFTVFERAFKDFGLPLAIRTDNSGTPSHDNGAFFGLSQAAGVVVAVGARDRAHQAGQFAAERSARAYPSSALEEGTHAAREELPAAAGEKFDRFIECYNQERPHHGAEHEVPGEIYRISPRRVNARSFLSSRPNHPIDRFAGAGCSKRSGQICNASQFQKNNPCSRWLTLAACTCAQSADP